MNTLYLVASFVRVTFDEAVHIVFEVLDGDLLAVQVDLKIFVRITCGFNFLFSES